MSFVNYSHYIVLDKLEYLSTATASFLLLNSVLVFIYNIFIIIQLKKLGFHCNSLFFSLGYLEVHFSISKNVEIF